METDIKLNGTYDSTFEPYLTCNICDYIFDSYKKQTKDPKEITEKMINNNRNIKINYFNSSYKLLDKNKRKKTIYKVPKEISIYNYKFIFINNGYVIQN